MIIELKTGTLLAQLGQVAFSTGASTLPQLGRFYAKRLSNKFILQYPYSYLQDSADLCNSCRPNSIHLIPFRLTIVSVSAMQPCTRSFIIIPLPPNQNL